MNLITNILSLIIANDSYPAAPIDETGNDRITIKDDEEKHVANAILQIVDVQMSDRGNYICSGESVYGDQLPVNGSTMVRVKGKLP